MPQRFLPIFSLLILIGMSACPLSPAAAQSADHLPAVHVDYIRSVRFHQTGLELTEPVLALNHPGTLTLTFDDLTGASVNYWYKIEQVNADWSPGQLQEFEWLDGFNDNRIEEFAYSISPRVSFTHYTLRIPNEQVRIKKSGNYVLRIYEDGDIPVITRRFVVVETEVIIQPNPQPAALVSKAQTHQEIDFKVDLKELLVHNPRQEIHATVLQNGFWPGAIRGITPFFIRGNILDFDYQDQVLFPAGKEWRFFDTRTLLTRTERVADLRQNAYQTEVDLVPDRSRAFPSYLFTPDINGRFVVQNFDMPQHQSLSADYTTVHFTYVAAAPYEGAHLYVIGAFNDFRCTPANRMEYSEATHSYGLTLSLKQGFYNYAYVLVPEGKDRWDWSDTEGDWYETENDYLILVYYRPIGERYDRVVGAYQFKSFQR